MRQLIIECATEACSVALLEGDELIDGRFEIIGRGHAERLVPMIAELPGMGRAERIVVSLGPGSFTGLRIGLAAARALGLAWNAQVLGYPTLALVAAMARAHHPRSAVTICMSGGHGEWFVQDFAGDGLVLNELASLSPARAAELPTQALVAGSEGEALVALRGRGEALPLLPDARQWGSTVESFLTDRLTPIYGRAPDATPLGVRR